MNETYEYDSQTEAEVRQRFDEDLKQLQPQFIPFRVQHKEAIIKIVALIYRKNVQQLAPNLLFSVIEDIIQGDLQ